MSTTKLAKEYPPPDEARYTDAIIDRLKAAVIREAASGITRRDAHIKMHGLVKAEFIIEPGLPAHLRVGVFRQAQTFPAWIRFSNASARLQPDLKKDIRGIAIKLMDVPGTKLLEDEKNALTQDFLLISVNVFLNKDVRGFYFFLQALSGSIFSKIVYFSTHWRLIWNVLTSLKRIANPLQVRYWSTTPYLFGDTAVKYSVIPHVDIADALPDAPDDDFLRQAMCRQLRQRPASFDFLVQLQTDADAMPIEDSSRAWDEAASPFLKVATIRIPQQEFDSEKQREFGENMSFTPWHCLPDHRPLGGINRARGAAYRAISMLRHQKNDAPRQEPTNWNI